MLQASVVTATSSSVGRARVLAKEARKLFDTDRHVVLRLPQHLRTELSSAVDSGELEVCAERATPLHVFGTDKPDPTAAPRTSS